MEKMRAEVNSLLPITFYRKETPNIVRRDDRNWSEEAKSLVQEVCVAIKDLSRQETNKKVLVLQGGYGCGKTTLLQIIIEELGRDDGEFKAEGLWFTTLNYYASFESLCLFLAEKAESLGMRDASQVLKKTTGETARRKEAAFSVFYHCKILFIDDIDANVSFDFEFLSHIACKELTIVAACTNLLSNKLETSRIIRIPEKAFQKSDLKLSILLPIYNSEQTDALVHLAGCLGPKFSAILIQALLHKVLTVEEALSCTQQLGKHEEMVEILLQEIICKIPAESLCALYCIAYVRTPLPLKDDSFFDLLLKLGLLCKFEMSNGKWAIQAPACITKVLKRLEISNQELFSTFRKENVPKSLELWRMLLPKILMDLINKAEDHAWPFVPEAWQYKDVIGEEEKYNLKDVIHRQNIYADIDEIDILKECLFSALVEENYKSASAILFVIDRFIYWQGLSNTAMKVTKYIKNKSPDTAIAPQIIIRKIRVQKNDGNIQGADKSLNRLIESKRTVGRWVFKTEADRQLVTSVCVQIKGDIYRGLGLWTLASTYIIKSIFGFKSLPKVDKKGWASSLSLLADAFQYMSLKDFNNTIKPKFQLTSDHPILEAIKCVNEASQLSIYSPLFFTKNKRRAGELMQIYSKILPENSSEIGFYLKYAATELIEGLKCHTSISSLQSREQFYEFVFCVYKLSQVLNELYDLQRIVGSSLNGTSKALMALSLKLYEHYCSFDLKIEHDDWSIMLIQTTLLLLNLPKLPLNENSMLPATDKALTLSPQRSDKETSKLTNQDGGTLSHVKAADFSVDVSKVEGRAKDNTNETKILGENHVQSLSTVDTDEVDQRNAPTATDTDESIEGARYREQTTASSNLQTRQYKDGDRNTEDDDGKVFEARSTVSTEEDGMTALREELGRMRMYSGNETGTSSQILLERKLERNEIAFNKESARMKRQWNDKTNYVQCATTATDTTEKTDDSPLKNESFSGQLLLPQGNDGDVTEAVDEAVDNGNEEGIEIDGIPEGSGNFEEEEVDSGIGVFRNNTTYLTEDDYMSNENSKKRMKTTMSTIEGNIGTKEQDALQIESALNVIRHSKAKVCSAKVWRYDPLSSTWSTSYTLVFVGEKLKLSEEKKGACRDAFKVEYINQEEPMGRYIGKQYKLEKYKDRPRSLQQYKQDVVCQVTSRFYATLFSQEMFRRGLPFGQVQFLPAVILELSNVSNDPEKYYNVEPYMAGSFTKISNNLSWVEKGDVAGKDLLLALSHFSYCASKGRIIIVDIQGWTSRDKTGATFLTDPQIHTRDKKGFGTANKGREGFDEFWASQHPKCNDICFKLELTRP